MTASQQRFTYIREAVAAADSSGLLTTTNRNWGGRSQTLGKPIPPDTQALELLFIGDHATDPNNLAATVKVWAYPLDGPAHLVKAFDLTVGQCQVVTKPTGNTAAGTAARWVDTIAPDDADPTNYWADDPYIVGTETDGIASIWFNTYGAAHITVEITALAAGLSLDVLMRPMSGLR